MNWRRIAFWFGMLALADAALLVSPLSVPGDGLVGIVPRAVVPLLALVAAGYGVKVLASARGPLPTREPPVTETAEPTTVERVGNDIDAAFDALGTDDRSSWSKLNAERMLRSELRRSARTALESRGHSREEAVGLLDSGAWTDDRRAGAFLGDVHLPLRMRVRDWASGERRRRQAEAAVDELLRLTEAPADEGPVPERRDREPAAATLGGAVGTGTRTRAEHSAELEPEVDA